MKRAQLEKIKIFIIDLTYDWDQHISNPFFVELIIYIINNTVKIVSELFNLNSKSVY